MAAPRRPAGGWGTAAGGAIAGLQLQPADCKRLGSCSPAWLAKVAALKVSNWFRWVRDVIDKYRADVSCDREELPFLYFFPRCFLSCGAILNRLSLETLLLI